MPDDNPAIPNAATGNAAIPADAINQNSATTEATVQSNAITGDYKPRFAQGNLIGDDILIFYHREIAIANCMYDYAKYVLAINPANIFGVGTFDGLFAKISEYQSIARLYIFAHGAAGEIIMNGQKLLSQLISTYQKDIVTKVTEFIQFEGCNVGNNPFQMNEFRKFFSCPKISGRNFFHILFPAKIPVVTSGFIRKSVLPTPVEFIFTTLYLDQMEATEQQAGTDLVPSLKYHWFREDHIALAPLSGYDQKTYYSIDDCSFVTLQSAIVKDKYVVPYPGLWMVSVVE